LQVEEDEAEEVSWLGGEEPRWLASDRRRRRRRRRTGKRGGRWRWSWRRFY